MSSCKVSESTFTKSIKCKDEMMREAHPGLNDLWEQYLVMYKLLDDGSIVEEVEEQQTAQDILAMIRSRRRSR